MTKSKQKNVLIVDDDEYTRGLIESFLQGLDLKIYQCAEGFSAIDEITTKDIDILVLDVSMPFIDGFKLLEILKRNRTLERISIIMLTGSSEEKDIVKASKYGVTDYIVKPAKREDFLARISRILHESDSFLVSKDEPKGMMSVNFKVNFKIKSLSSWGVYFSSNIGFPSDFIFDQIELPFLPKEYLSGVQFRVLKCPNDKHGEFLYHFSFLDLSEDRRKQIQMKLEEHRNSN